MVTLSTVDVGYVAGVANESGELINFDGSTTPHAVKPSRVLNIGFIYLSAYGSFTYGDPTPVTNTNPPMTPTVSPQTIFAL